MTCIVGLVDNGRVYMGADSAGVAGLNLRKRADEKVFINGEFLMGFTTSFRMGQILRYSFEAPNRYEEENKEKYLYVRVISEIMKVLKDNQYAKIKDNELSGGTFLFGYRGELYEVYDDFQIGKSINPFAACGCGQNYALGSLFSTTGQLPKDRIEKALEAAEEFSAGVRAPFYILDI